MEFISHVITFVLIAIGVLLMTVIAIHAIAYAASAGFYSAQRRYRSVKPVANTNLHTLSVSPDAIKAIHEAMKGIK